MGKLTQDMINAIRESVRNNGIILDTSETSLVRLQHMLKETIDPFVMRIRQGEAIVKRVSFTESYEKGEDGNPGEKYSSLVFHYESYVNGEHEFVMNDFSLCENMFVPGSRNFIELFAVAEDITGMPIGILTHGHFDYLELDNA